MKAKARANNITSKKCAFCKNWYDPANSAIKPCGTITWEYDMEMKCMCRVKKVLKRDFNRVPNLNQKFRGKKMGKLDDLRQLTEGLIVMHMDDKYGVNKLENAKEEFKVNLRDAIITNLILAAVCVGIMYLRFRVFGK